MVQRYEREARMNLVLRDRMDAFEEKLREFDFDWRGTSDWHSGGFEDKMRRTEWHLLIEAEQIGPDAMMLLRKYQTGMA